MKKVTISWKEGEKLNLSYEGTLDDVLNVLGTAAALAVGQFAKKGKIKASGLAVKALSAIGNVMGNKLR